MKRLRRLGKKGAGQSLEGITVVILDVRGHFQTECGGDPAQNVPEGHDIPGLRHFLTWIPDLRHACSFSSPLRWGACSDEDADDKIIHPITLKRARTGLSFFRVCAYVRRAGFVRLW
jgi:hypothetical protein